MSTDTPPSSNTSRLAPSEVASERRAGVASSAIATRDQRLRMKPKAMCAELSRALDFDIVKSVERCLKAGATLGETARQMRIRGAPADFSHEDVQRIAAVARGRRQRIANRKRKKREAAQQQQRRAQAANAALLRSLTGQRTSRWIDTSHAGPVREVSGGLPGSKRRA